MSGASKEAARPAPRYAEIGMRVAAAIEAGALPAGLVMTEHPVAQIFGTSRTPVRMALGELEERGLLVRFGGRGYVVSGAAEPLRLPLTPDMLGLDAAPGAASVPAAAAERIERDFEESVTRALPFGLYRIGEQSAADHYGVSRTVVRELLSRFQDRGLVRKDSRSHWVVGPLTAEDIGHHFAIRGKLEPLALLNSAPRLSADELSGMLERLERAIGDGPAHPPEGLALIEADLHVRLLERAGNPHLLRMIRQSQVALAINRIFASAVGARPFAVSLPEHRIVLSFLIRGSWNAAAMALEAHLDLSARRTRRRLMSISVFPEPILPEYLRRISA